MRRLRVGPPISRITTRPGRSGSGPPGGLKDDVHNRFTCASDRLGLQAPRARAHRRRVRADRREARARAERRRAGDVQPAVVRALRLQALAQAAAPAADRGRPRVVMGPGENAGAVDVGDGWAVAFKVESHNHPSAVEPFQGAATGVGGILRDVFALGARPIAMLDSLRFGELDSERSRYLFDHVVAGIGHYGNSIGVPTVGGEIYFEAPYEQNCLVNAMCVGLARADEMVRAAAAGVGNAVVLMGASTGPRRDRRRLGARLGRARGGRRREAPDGPDRRPVRGDEGARVLPRAARRRACSSRFRTSAPPGSPPRPARWPRRAGSGSTSTSPGCRCARPTWSRSRSWSPSRRSGCSPWSSRPRSTRCSRVCERWETGRAVIGEVTDTGTVPGAARRRGRRRDAGRGAGRRLPALRPRARRSRARGSTATRRRSSLVAREQDDAERDAAGAARVAQRRLQALGVRAVRLGRRLAHGAPARVGRRRRAPAARGRQRDRGLDRRQRAPRRLRSLRRHDRGGARVRRRTSPASAPSRSA